ncbi:sperm-associated antigen 1 [Clarias gariepinus]
MSAEGLSSLLMTSSSSVRSHTPPVEHLDYAYIQQCVDLKYLEKILNVLRSGTEGVYPHLVEFCEKRIEALDPRHRALRKDSRPATAASFSSDEWRRITDELQAWQREITESEHKLMQSPIFNIDTLPSVNNRTLQRPRNTTSSTTHRKRCAAPRSYSDWDRFDVEEECARVDKSTNTSDTPVVVNSAHSHLKQHIDTSALSQQERCVLATREREKGNEAFRAGDWDEAVIYYTRSLSILPTVAGFNNRAQAEIKLQRWTDALRDCDAVLDIETHNSKALLRRATVNKHLGALQAVHDDLTTVLESEPYNITAQKLLLEVNKQLNLELHHKSQPPHEPIGGKKLLIQEVDEGKEEETGGETDAGGAEVDKQALSDEEGQTDGETEGQRDGKTEGQRDRETERQRDGETEGQRDGETEGQRDGKTEGQRDGETEGQRDGETEGQRDGKTEGQRDGETEGQRDGETEGQRDGETEGQRDGVRQGVNAAVMRTEGNELYRSGQYGDAAEKYTHGITTLTQSGVYSDEDLFVLYCNRAACFLKMGLSSECVSDCSRALQLKPFSVKALLRRAMAFETLEHFRLAYVDYKTVQQIHNTQSVQQQVNRLTRMLMEQDGSDWRTKLPEVPPTSQTTPNTLTVPNSKFPPTIKTPPITQGPTAMEILLHKEAPPIDDLSQPRRHITIVEVESDDDGDEDGPAAAEDPDGEDDDGNYKEPGDEGDEDEKGPGDDEGGDDDVRDEGGDDEKGPGDDEGGDDDVGDEGGDDVMTSCPTNAFEFGQALNAARCHGDLVACAQLLRSVPPHTLPEHISTQLDTHTLSFITHTLHTHILATDPGLVYRLLTHLHTAGRFRVALMLMDSDERGQITQLFGCLSIVECDEFTHENIESLADKFL